MIPVLRPEDPLEFMSQIVPATASVTNWPLNGGFGNIELPVLIPAPGIGDAMDTPDFGRERLVSGESLEATIHDGQMVRRLAEQKVFVDCRPGVGLRMSPHFFNTDEEVREAMETLANLLNV